MSKARLSKQVMDSAAVLCSSVGEVAQRLNSCFSTAAAAGEIHWRLSLRTQLAGGTCGTCSASFNCTTSLMTPSTTPSHGWVVVASLPPVASDCAGHLCFGPRPWQRCLGSYKPRGSNELAPCLIQQPGCIKLHIKRGHTHTHTCMHEHVQVLLGHPNCMPSMKRLLLCAGFADWDALSLCMPVLSRCVGGLAQPWNLCWSIPLGASFRPHFGRDGFPTLSTLLAHGFAGPLVHAAHKATTRRCPSDLMKILSLLHL